MSDDRDEASNRPLPTGAPSRSLFCVLCRGSGLIDARPRDEPTLIPTTFRCTCFHGESDRRNFPSWRDAGPNFVRCD